MRVVRNLHLFLLCWSLVGCPDNDDGPSSNNDTGDITGQSDVVALQDIVERADAALTDSNDAIDLTTDPEVLDEPSTDPIDDAPTCTPTLPPDGVPIEPRATIVEEFDLVVSSGNRIYGLIQRPDPDLYPGLCFPAVVLVPGGVNPGRMEGRGRDAGILAEAGMVVVAFNSEGRFSDMYGDIASEGEPDFNGFRDQQALCEVVLHTIDLDYVIDDNVGLRSQSFGIAMAAGCAGRHPDIPIQYIVDGEGPPNSFVTCHEPYALVPEHPDSDKFELVHDILDGHYSIHRDPSEPNVQWWEEREAERFIGGFQGRYLRLQAQWDHAQPPSSEDEMVMFDLPELDWWHNKHTTDIVNTAVAAGVPWVRVNLLRHGNAVNTTYDYDNRPVFLPGHLADNVWAVQAVLEMATME